MSGGNPEDRKQSMPLKVKEFKVVKAMMERLMGERIDLKSARSFLGDTIKDMHNEIDKVQQMLQLSLHAQEVMRRMELAAQEEMSRAYQNRGRAIETEASTAVASSSGAMSVSGAAADPYFDDMEGLLEYAPNSSTCEGNSDAETEDDTSNPENFK